MANASPDRYDYDRDRGIFTPRDRRFLAGELDDGELSEDAIRQKRYRLRQRTFHAIQDLAFLEEMETRDLFHITDDINQSINTDLGGIHITAADSEKYRQIFRTRQAMLAIISLFREMFSPETFGGYIEHQFEIRAALDHFEETGEYGLFDATVNVDLKNKMTVYELLNAYIESDENGTEFPGALEVINQSPLPQEYAAAPEKYRLVLDVVEELDGGEGADRNLVIQELMARADVQKMKARHYMESVIATGFCTRNSDGNLSVVEESPEK